MVLADLNKQAQFFPPLESFLAAWYTVIRLQMGGLLKWGAFKCLCQMNKL